MAREFVPADNDKITTAFTSHATARTYHIKAFTDGAGGGGRGRVFEKRNGGAEVEILYYNTADANQPFLEYDRAWSGTDGRWRTPTNSLTLGQWVDIILTYDAGATTNDPLVYFDGVSQTITQLVGDPTGAPDTNTDAYILGARGDATTRNFDGKLAEWAIWDRILTAAEVDGIGAKGYSPLFYPASLVSYIPLIRGMNDYKNAVATDTGTGEFAHPRVIYPAGYQIAPFSSGTNYTSTFSDDTITISEPSILRALTKTPTETITISEPSFIKAITRSLSESLTLTEVFSTVRGYFASLSDTLTITDTLSYLQARFKSFSETVTITDTLEKSFVFFQSLSDTLTITDTISNVRGFILTDVITMKDWLWRWAKHIPNLFVKDTAHASSWTKENQDTVTWVQEGGTVIDTGWT